MAETLTNVLLHAVFSTKGRSKVLDDAVRRRLWPYLTKLLQNRGCRVYTVNGGLEHVHVVFRQPTDRATAELLRDLKTNSSKWIRESFPDRRDFAWQRGYAGFSVSYSNLEAVCKYVDDQELHHRRHSFEDELIGLLKKNELHFDEKYLWS